MANELWARNPGSNTLYAIIRRKSDMKVWDAANGAWETWADGSIDDYDIVLADKSGDVHAATFPSAIAQGIRYIVIYYIRSGSTPATNDLIADYWEGIWNGSFVDTGAGAVTYPITLAQAKLYLQVEHTVYDDLINDLIAAATKAIENITYGPMLTVTKYDYLDDWPDKDNFIELKYRPVDSITSVKYTNSAGTESTWSTDYYIKDTDSFYSRIVLAYSLSWPTETLYPSNPIKIEYVAGYGASGSDVPAPLKEVIKRLVRRWYENREGEQIVAKADLAGLGEYIPVRF